MREADPSAPFASTFSQALAQSGMTLSGLRQRLLDRGTVVSLASLSYWRSGARVPTGGVRQDVIVEIERLLGLEDDALSALAAQAARQADGGDPVGCSSATEGEDPIVVAFRRAERELQIPEQGRFRELALQQIVEVDSRGKARTSRLQIALQCVGGVVTRAVFGASSADGQAASHHVDGVHGGTVVDRYVDAEGTLVAVAIELERPLSAGDTCVVEGRLRRGESGRAEPGITLEALRPARKMMNWVHFHPDAVPDWICETEVREGSAARRFRGLDTPTSIHQVRWDFGPGSMRLDWGYGQPPVSGCAS